MIQCKALHHKLLYSIVLLMSVGEIMERAVNPCRQRCQYLSLKPMENIRKTFWKIWPLVLRTIKYEERTVSRMFLLFHIENEVNCMKVIVRMKFKNFSKDISVHNLERVSFFLFLLIYLFRKSNSVVFWHLAGTFFFFYIFTVLLIANGLLNL